MINQVYYLEVLEHVKDAVWGKLPEMWSARIWYLHYKNAWTHTALMILSFCKGIHSSPAITSLVTWLIPSRFLLLPTIKITLKGTFKKAEDIITKTAQKMKVIQQKSFTEHFQRWKRQWRGQMQLVHNTTYKGYYWWIPGILWTNIIQNIKWLVNMNSRGLKEMIMAQMKMLSWWHLTGGTE